MGKIRTIILVVALALVAGCQWVEAPPDVASELFWQGAVAGCIRMNVHALGPMSEQDREAVIYQCLVVAAEVLEMRADGLQLPPMPQGAPVHDLPPGSTL